MRFLKHSAVYGSSQLLTRGINALLLPVYTRVLTPTDYGVLETLTIAVALLTTGLSVEIPQGVGRFFSDSHDAEDRRAYASTGLWFTLSTFLSFAVLALIVAPGAAVWLLGTPGRTNIVRAGAIGLVMQGLFYLTMEQLRWMIRPQLHAITSVTTSLVLIGATAFMVVVLRTGVIGVIYGQLIGNSVGVAMALWFGRASYRFTFDSARLRTMLHFSAPLVPSTAALVVASMVDRIAVRSILGLAAVGIYGIALRFALLISLVMIGVNGAFMPLVFRHHGHRETPAAVADIFRYFVYLAVLVFLFMSMFSEWILRIITTPAFYQAGLVVPLVVVAATLGSLSVFTPGLQLAKRTLAIAFVNSAAALVNAALAVTLVPRLGLIGAALGTAISFGAAFIVLMRLSQQSYQVPHNWLRLALGASVAVVCAIVGRSLFHAEPAAGTGSTLLGELVLFAAAATLVTLVLLDRRELGILHQRLASGRMPTPHGAGGNERGREATE